MRCAGLARTGPAPWVTLSQCGNWWKRNDALGHEPPIFHGRAMSALRPKASKPRLVLSDALGPEQPAATIEREGRWSTNCPNCILILGYRGREAPAGQRGARPLPGRRPAVRFSADCASCRSRLPTRAFFFQFGPCSMSATSRRTRRMNEQRLRLIELAVISLCAARIVA
jgi:hypothetical protein